MYIVYNNNSEVIAKVESKEEAIKIAKENNGYILERFSLI